MVTDKKKTTKKASEGKSSGRTRRGSRAVLNFTELEEKEISLEKGTVESLNVEAKKLSKKGRKISPDSVLANIALHEAASLRFKVLKREKSKIKLTLPAGIWELLEEAANRNNSSIEETIDHLMKSV